MSRELEPGWYTSEQGKKSYWNGEEWLVPGAEQATGSDLEIGTNVAPQPQDHNESKKSPERKWKALVVVSAVAVLALAGGGTTWWLLSHDSRRDAQAISVCEEALRDMLKSPSSAVFYDSSVQSKVDYYTNSVAASLAEAWVSGDYSQEQWDEASQRFEEYKEELLSQEQQEIADGTISYVVTGEVDAENGFGAISREMWACSTSWEDGELTRPIVLEFGDEYSLGS